MERVTCMFFLVLTLHSTVGVDLQPGSACSLDDGRRGLCKKLGECQKALDELKEERKPPTTCSFDKFEPIVCCPGAAAPLTSPASISAKKCEEYSQYVYIKEYSWVPGSKPMNRSRCGAADSGTILVIDGEKAGPREFPHMALIGYGHKDNIAWGCGGSLISEQYVLTAAHCASSREGSPAKWVLLGDLVLSTSDDDAEPQLLEVSSIALGPGFSPGYRYNDIALLKLKSEVKLNDYVRPACLHVPRSITIKDGIASGWGKTSNYNESLSDALRKVALPLRRIDECAEAHSHLRDKHRTKSGFDDDTMLCIGDPVRAKDTCRGDSGGPFQTLLKTPYCMYEVLGVTSFGLSHCGTSTPAVYTRVSAFVPWIESVVWPGY